MVSERGVPFLGTPFGHRTGKERKMKRSVINAAIRRAVALLEGNGMRLPGFAYWDMDTWRKNRDSLDNLRRIMLGWDVTDFGSGDFEKIGATLFTLRNGLPDGSAGTPYAEKLIFLWHEAEQEIPMHYHAVKTEDIINRGGGILMLELFNADEKGGIDRKTPLCVKLDGIVRTLPAGAVVEVLQGESITLTPRLHHRFWAKRGYGDLIAGEVSSVNDDRTDNYFFENRPRYVEYTEDEAPLHPLCNELDTL